MKRVRDESDEFTRTCAEIRKLDGEIGRLHLKYKHCHQQFTDMIIARGILRKYAVPSNIALLIDEDLQRLSEASNSAQIARDGAVAERIELKRAIAGTCPCSRETLVEMHVSDYNRQVWEDSCFVECEIFYICGICDAFINAYVGARPFYEKCTIYGDYNGNCKGGEGVI